MTRLQKISIQGFKSFKKKISIPFPTGFSAITGPNGSGKTNISDAIIFVLGKSSSKSIRAKKAENLIFHGSKKKTGSDYAIVTLYFDNSKNELPFDDDVVTTSRRINKKGVSTYRLNGRIATRQQITDAFIQAKIYPDGHNILKQGDINHIVEMDPVQRRKIIDEIAGIAEYDEKREKALKELETIERRVKEAEILLTEKNITMERLRKEMESAVSYKKLESDLMKIRTSLVWNEYSKSSESLDKVSKVLDEKEKLAVGLEKEIKSLDSQIQKQEENLEALTKNVMEASSQIEVTNKINKLRFEIESKKDRIESNRREIERLESFSERLKTLDRKFNPAFKAVESFKGVHGVLSDLITVPARYKTSAEIAAGSHLQDIVVDNTRTAVKCIKYLKEKRVGRSRFLPLDKIRAFGKKPLPRGAIGWVSNLITYDASYEAAIDYVFSGTACVKDIDTAKQIFSIQRTRMVTLDGDLIEASGAMTGGFYKRKTGTEEISKYSKTKKSLEKEIYGMETELTALNKELEILASKEKKTKTFGLERGRVKIDETLKKLREKRKEAYENRLIMQQEMGKKSIQKAKLEARFDDLEVRLAGKKGQKVKMTAKEKENVEPFIDMSVKELNEKESHTLNALHEIGPVNLKAPEDYEFLKQEFDEFREKVDKIVEEKQSIESTLSKIEEKRKTTFEVTLNEISRNFTRVYKELTSGVAELGLEDPNSIESGLLIKASPPGKKLLHIDSMSGGEKTITAFTFLFAIQRHRPTPFYILDEADAALDKVNTKRVAQLIKKQSKDVQFITISHNDDLVREADQIYGITMEDGESKVMGIEVPPQKNN